MSRTVRSLAPNINAMQPEQAWKYQISPPSWYRRWLNNRLRRKQDREMKQEGEVKTPGKKDLAYFWW